MDSDARVSLMRRVLRIFGVDAQKSVKARSITDCVKRVGQMEEKVERLEAVTMAWSLDSLTPEQRKQMGLEE